ncbi:MAG: hypothetical protein AAFR59_16365 [Bacteroidota bacterium]
MKNSIQSWILLGAFLCLFDLYGYSLTDREGHDLGTLNVIALTAPADGAVLSSFYPIFNWQWPAAPAGNVTYAIKIVPINAGQNRADAMQFNAPVYTQSNITANFVQYGSGGASIPLSAGEEYVWRVEAYVDGNLAGSSDIWLFSLASQPDEPAQMQYAALSTKPDAGYHLLNTDDLHFRFDNIYYKGSQAPNDIAQIQVRTPDGTLLSNWTLQHDGYNLFTLDFASGTPSLSGLYTVKVQTIKDRIYWLRFLIP